MIWSIYGAAVSTNGGGAFRSLNIPAGDQLIGLSLTSVDSRARVSIVTSRRGYVAPTRLWYSDDLGGSWRAALISADLQSAQLSLLSAAGPTGLIGPAMTLDANKPFEYVCSIDGGAAWSGC